MSHFSFTDNRKSSDSLFVYFFATYTAGKKADTRISTSSRFAAAYSFYPGHFPATVLPEIYPEEFHLKKTVVIRRKYAGIPMKTRLNLMLIKAFPRLISK